MSMLSRREFCSALSFAPFVPGYLNATRCGGVAFDTGKAVTPMREADDSPCAQASAQRAVCAAANGHAVALMRADQLTAATVVQDVRAGALLAFAASEPERLDVSARILPLSLTKLLLAASWWDRNQPETEFDRYPPDSPNPPKKVSIQEMLVMSVDHAGRQMATALRNAVGTAAVLRDLRRYGFGPRTAAQRDATFWAELAPAWRARLLPAAAYHSLSERSGAAEWADALSIGESNFTVTVLRLSRFLQAVGNGGLSLPLVARVEQPASKNARPLRMRPRRVMRERTAPRLQAALREAAQRGTARSIATALADTGWQIGGKTGTGPKQVGPESDGCFAGLIFDPQGQARFTVATFVRHGGPGGGNAAKISAKVAKFLLEVKTR